MKNVDVLILILLIVAAGRGFFKGFIRELLSVAAALVTVFFGAAFVFWITPTLRNYFGNTLWLPLLSYFIVISGIYLVFALIGKLIESGLRLMQLGLVNRLAGALVGAFKAALLISFVIWIGSITNIISEGIKGNSILYDKIAPIAPWVFSWVKVIFPSLLTHFPKFHS